MGFSGDARLFFFSPVEWHSEIDSCRPRERKITGVFGGENDTLDELGQEDHQRLQSPQSQTVQTTSIRQELLQYPVSNQQTEGHLFPS